MIAQKLSPKYDKINKQKEKNPREKAQGRVPFINTLRN